jgi:hypothetical protein
MALELDRPPLTQILAAGAGLALVAAVAGWSLVHRARAQTQLPGDTDLAAAAAWVGKDAQVGDVLAYSPDWSAAQRWRFTGAFAGKGLDGDRATVLGYPLDPWDFDGFQRAWVVSTHGLGGNVFMPPPARLLRARSFGHGTEVSLWQLAPSDTVLDLARTLPSALVERENEDGSWFTCPWRDGEFDCAPDHWKKVLFDVAQVGSGRRSCVYVTPHRNGAWTRLTWRGVPGAEHLEGHFGLRMWSVRNDEGSDLRFRVRVGGDVVYERAAKRGEFQWVPWHVGLQPGQRGQDVSFELMADDIAWRYGCFDARLRGAAAATARGSSLPLPVPATASAQPPDASDSPLAAPPELFFPRGLLPEHPARRPAP